jgi:hypothetical protein
MAETLQERIKRALATDPRIDVRRIASVGPTITVEVVEKIRDRGREAATKIFARTGRETIQVGNFIFTIEGNFDASEHFRIENNIATIVNASNADLLREVLEIVKDKNLMLEDKCFLIAALLPETTP